MTDSEIFVQNNPFKKQAEDDEKIMISNSQNFDLSEKRISQHLEDLIDAANKTFKTAGEQILEIYYQAIKEGFTPHQAKILIKQRVVHVSDRHIRRILPDEAKDQSKKHLYINHDEDIRPQILHNSNENSQQLEKNVVNITDSFQDIATQKLKELPEQEQELSPENLSKSEDQVQITSEMQRLRRELNEAREIINQQAEKIEQLSIKQVKTFGHKFTFPFDFESPDGTIVPVLVTAFPDKQTGYVIFDKKRGANK